MSGNIFQKLFQGNDKAVPDHVPVRDAVPETPKGPGFFAKVGMFFSSVRRMTVSFFTMAVAFSIVGGGVWFAMTDNNDVAAIRWKLQGRGDFIESYIPEYREAVEEKLRQKVRLKMLNDLRQEKVNDLNAVDKQISDTVSAIDRSNATIASIEDVVNGDVVGKPRETAEAVPVGKSAENVKAPAAEPAKANSGSSEKVALPAPAAVQPKPKRDLDALVEELSKK